MASLPLTQDVLALSGTLTSSQVVTAPRESGGAGGGATLIHTAASTTASAPETSTTTSTNVAPEETSTTRSSSGGGSRRRAQTEEGRNRRHGNTTSTGTTRRSGGGGKVVAESKDKVVTPVAAPKEKPIFSISSGIESRYIFHGLDIISFNTYQSLSRETQTSAIFYVGADAAYKGGHFGVTYVQSFDRLHPYITSVIGASTGNFPKEFYQELDFNLDYTAHVVANILDATIGYNSYVFLDSGFKGTNYQGEVLFRLAYKQIPYVTPSFSYYYYASPFHDTKVGSLNGSLTEFRVDGLFPLYRSENLTVQFAPYVSSVYNINYLNWDAPSATDSGNNVGGWSYLETGIKIPVTIAKHFTVTPYGNYGLDLTDSDTRPINSHAFGGKGGNGIYGEKTSFWFGVTASYTF